MTDRMNRPLDDALIAAAIERRAPGHADRELLRDILVAAEDSRQVRGWWWGRPGIPVRATLLFVAIALLLATALVLAAVGAFHLTQPSPTLPAKVSGLGPSASAITSSPAIEPSPSAGSGQSCGTDTAQVSVGGSMPPTSVEPATVRAGVISDGAYLTFGPDASVVADLWFLDGGVARRIASVAGPGINIVNVQDISADGRQVLVGVGELHGGLPRPSCDDLYVVRTDRESVTRITSNRAGQYATDGSFSADGRYVAYRQDEDAASSSAFGVVDLVGDGTPRLGLCAADATGLVARWAPDDNRLAILCDGNLEMDFVDDNHAGSIPVSFPVTSPLGFAWTSPTRIDIATSTQGNASGRVTHVVYAMPGGGFASENGSFGAPVDSTDAFSELQVGSGAFSAGGGSLAFRGTATTDDGWWVMRADGGTLYATSGRHPAPEDRLEWSVDGKRLAYIDAGPLGNDRHIVVTIVGSGVDNAYGTIPDSYASGIWRAWSP